MKYIEFLPFLPLQNTFEYKTTLDIEIGDVIRCRFGRFDTLGIVLSVHTTKQTHHELTSVSEIIFKNLLQSKLIELIKALEKYYGYSGGLFAKLFFPFSIKNSQFPYHTEMVKLSEEAKIDSSKSAKWKIIYNTLKNGNSVESSAFTGLTPFKKKNLLHFYFQKNHHKNFQESAIINTILPELSPEQNTVFSEIIKNTTSFKVHLIHGKTGSGKTEVYAHLVQRVVDVGAVSEPRVCRHISQGEIEGMPECEPLEEGETPQKSPPQAQAGESGDALHTSKLHDGKTQACVMDNAKTMASHEAQHNATVKVGSEDISRQNSTPPQAPALDRCSPSPPRSARSELSGLRAPPPSFNSTSPQILILLPEIGLAKVIAERLAKRFNCIIPIWHSSTPENKRKEYFRLIQDGACNVVVGTRSALFLPFKNLRMIIIDEEHDGSYKQEEAPIYNARDTAVLYGKLLNIPVILGSATPSVESYFNIQNGKYYLHELNARYTNIQMPEIQIINEKSKTFLSPTLQTKIIENYIAGKQTLIFINRRGFAPVNRCKCCNGIFKCEACDSLLTYHKKKSILTCHKCNFTIPLHSTCTMCGEDINIHSSGAGVEAVHEEVVKLVKGCYEQNKIIAVSEPRSEADVSHLKQQYFANKVCRHISQGEIEGMPECEPL
ncbi:MAG: primosomal protein N', partial [Proteobacteria bacterium]|nr:primosomal protein N' [Pseudomonadota bacterium]